MVNKEEIQKLLSQLNEWDENNALIKYPQSLLNLVGNRFNPMETIKLGQPDYIIEGNIAAGPKAIDHYIEIAGIKFPLSTSIKEIKQYLLSL